MLFFILSAIGKVLTKDEERDRDIMARIKARDASALSELYDQYNRLLFGLILSILKKERKRKTPFRKFLHRSGKKLNSLIWNEELCTPGLFP